jgi:RNA polymerase sigma-70 factor (ECF subfamily)
VVRASAETDERLLDEYAAGDEQAFSRLLERHHAGVSRFAARRLGARRDWAEDVAQEVFIKVYRASARFERRSTFRTWLFGIALNVCRDFVRRESSVSANDTSPVDLPDGSLDPLQRLERIERAAVVRSAVKAIAPGHRLMLRLREREDMSYEEMARLLAVPVGTVRSRLHNARAALAQALIDKQPSLAKGDQRELQ